MISLSGRNALPVEMALDARARGLKVIGVTSLAYAERTRPRHASGTFLKDHCDVVLDNKIAVGDAELTATGVPAPFGARVDGGDQRADAGGDGHRRDRARRPRLTPPMLRSGNVDGGHDWNAGLDRAPDRIFFRH